MCVYVMCVCYVPGSHVVSGSSDSTARVWCLKQQECTHVLEGHTDSVNDVKCKVSRPWLCPFLHLQKFAPSRS